MNIKSVPFQRLGNKMNDIKYFKNLLPFEKIKNVIEPFCGSFAVSRICYNPNDYKIYLNDNDKSLIDSLNNINEFEEEYDEFSKATQNDFVPALMLLTLDEEENATDVKLLAPDRDFNDIYEGIDLIKEYLL